MGEKIIEGSYTVEGETRSPLPPSRPAREPFIGSWTSVLILLGLVALRAFWVYVTEYVN